MKCVKRFSRSVRQEINRISMSLKQMEFRMLRMRGFLRRKLREEIQTLKRMRDAILHQLSSLSPDAGLQPATMQAIRDDIARLHASCRQVRTHYF